MQAAPVTLKQIIKINYMNVKVVTDALFNLDATIGWLCSATLLFIGHWTIAGSIGQFTTIAGTLIALGGGVFSMLKMYEGWLKARAERKEAEIKLHNTEGEGEGDDEEDDQITGAGGNG